MSLPVKKFNLKSKRKTPPGTFESETNPDRLYFIHESSPVNGECPRHESLVGLVCRGCGGDLLYGSCSGEFYCGCEALGTQQFPCAPTKSFLKDDPTQPVEHHSEPLPVSPKSRRTDLQTLCPYCGKPLSAPTLHVDTTGDSEDVCRCGPPMAMGRGFEWQRLILEKDN